MKTKHIKNYKLPNFTEDWKDNFNLSISKALLKENIKGCGQFMYKQSTKNKNVFCVLCTNDGDNWKEYFVTVE